MLSTGTLARMMMMMIIGGYAIFMRIRIATASCHWPARIHLVNVKPHR